MNNKYINQYNKQNYKQYIFRVRKDDRKIISKLDKINNRNNYLYNLVLNDIKSDVLTLKQIKEIIKPILNNYGIKKICLFGSYARGEANKDSDIDIFCDKGNATSFIKQAALIDELEKALNKKVDIVFSTAELKDNFKKNIMKDMIELY